MIGFRFSQGTLQINYFFWEVSATCLAAAEWSAFNGLQWTGS